ncbi:hypothetical protein CLV90_1688 [Maribacter spongiicola]|uniref:Uncharacterized protein n=2 Tax=Maribacter spongiicola TaxID=1206753 RepID=A0A4R7K920_9FLAO|nr:hypothetical protein CLV90_1688 [Maribacter spongiicola]
MLKSSITTLLFVYNIILFNSCADKQKSLKTNEKIITERTTVSLSGFEYISDFDKYMAEFTSQKVELNNLSTEGGELTIFNNKTSNYRVYDFWLYGETGKLNYTFWVAKNNSKDFKFIKQIDYQYDRPYYIEDYKTDSVFILLPTKYPTL